MKTLSPCYIDWQVVDINEEPYVVFTAMGVEEEQNRPYTYIRRIAQLTVEDTEGKHNQHYVCRVLEDNTPVYFLPAGEIENHLSSGTLEKLGQEDEIVLGDGRALNFVITKSKLVTNVTDWSKVIPCDTDEFKQVDEEMKKNMFCGPQPKGMPKVRNMVRHLIGYPKNISSLI